MAAASRSSTRSVPVDDSFLPIEKTPEAQLVLSGRYSGIRNTVLRLAINGALGQWGQIFSMSGWNTVFIGCAIPIFASLPVSILVVWALDVKIRDETYWYEEGCDDDPKKDGCDEPDGINMWNRETWSFTSSAVAFLLNQKLKLSFNRWWEARGHLGTAVKCCRSMLILVKPRLVEGHKRANECADDVRRYCMLYYWLMSFQLLGIDLKQPVVMHHLTNRPEVRPSRRGVRGGTAPRRLDLRRDLPAGHSRLFLLELYRKCKSN